MSYRKLSEQERASLQQGGNSCTDWDGLYVKEGFDPAYVRNCRFSGTVCLGNFKSQHELPGGFTVHSGIYNAALNDVTVGDDVLIYNVSGYISRYDIGDRVIIFDCGNIYTREGSVFGCGTEVSVLDEMGGKTVRIFPGMSSSYAWLAVFERNAAFQNAIDSMVSSVTASLKSDRGRIGEGTLLASAMTVDSVDIADNVTVDGAAKLRNGMIESGCTIGYGVIMEHFILSRLSKVKGGSKVMSSFVGETAIIDSHYCAKDSLIFSNCHFENGEICAAFAGPHTVAHHKSILLIGGMYSFFNAGSGANHSNHLYQLGPRHYGILERGCKMASDSYLMLPAHIGEYSLIIGRHHRHRDSSRFPFSYLLERRGCTYCMPGAVLSGVGLFRDVSKWPKRDRRPGRKGYDKVVYDLYLPSLCDAMINAKAVLERALADMPQVDGIRIDVMDKGDFVIDGLYMTYDAVVNGIKYYSTAIAIALGDAFLYSRNHDAVSRESISGESRDYDKWLDLSGLPVPEDAVRNIVEEVVSGKLSDVSAIDRELTRLYENYPAYKNAWFKRRMFYMNLSPEEIIENRNRAVDEMNRMIESSATRDYILSHMLDKEDVSKGNAEEYEGYLLSYSDDVRP